MNSVNPFSVMSLEEILDDLTSRFIINVPEEETSTIERICFQVEQAHWFYEDYIREQNPGLASFSLKNFAALLFHHCPVLERWSGNESEEAFKRFIKYKVRVPVCGGILLNETLDKVLLVKGWSKRSTWSFPRGKINKGEPELDCAVRELLEETGFDATDKMSTSPNDYVELTLKEQKIRLYIVPGVPENYLFMPKTRKEISAIAWFPLSSLPALRSKGNEKQLAPTVANMVLNMESDGLLNTMQDSSAKEALQKKLFAGNSQQFYLVAPFAAHLRRWLKANKPRITAAHAQVEGSLDATSDNTADEEDAGRADVEPLLLFGNLDHGQADTNQISNAIMSLLHIAPKSPLPNEAASASFEEAANSANAQELVSDATGASIQARKTNNDSYFRSLLGSAINAKNTNSELDVNDSMSSEKASLLYLVQHGPSTGTSQSNQTTSNAKQNSSLGMSQPQQLLQILQMGVPLQDSVQPTRVMEPHLPVTKLPNSSSLLLSSILQDNSNSIEKPADVSLPFTQPRVTGGDDKSCELLSEVDGAVSQENSSSLLLSILQQSSSVSQVPLAPQAPQAPQAPLDQRDPQSKGQVKSNSIGSISRDNSKNPLLDFEFDVSSIMKSFSLKND